MEQPPDGRSELARQPEAVGGQPVLEAAVILETEPVDRAPPDPPAQGRHAVESPWWVPPSGWSPGGAQLRSSSFRPSLIGSSTVAASPPATSRTLRPTTAQRNLRVRRKAQA